MSRKQKQRLKIKLDNFYTENLIPENVDWDSLIRFVDQSITSRGKKERSKGSYGIMAWDEEECPLEFPEDGSWIGMSGTDKQAMFDDKGHKTYWIDAISMIEHSYKNYIIKFMKGLYEDSNIFTKYDDSCMFDYWIEDWYMGFTTSIEPKEREVLYNDFCPNRPNGIDPDKYMNKILSSKVEKWKDEIYELLDVFTDKNLSMDIPFTTLN